MPEKQTAAPFNEQEEWLRITLSSIGDAVITTDLKGAVTFMNPVAESLTGWTLADASGVPLDTVFRIVNEETRRTVESPVTKALKEGVVVGLANHTLLIARDGTERPVDDSAAPIRNAQGKVAGVVLVFWDVTERRKAEHALQESEERFRLLVEGTRDYAIFLLDPQGVITSWNPGAERIKGYRADEIIGKHFSCFYPPEAVETRWPWKELEAAAAGGRFEDEGWRLRKDGSKFWANVIITALKDHHGNLRGFSKITRDLTQRKQAEEDARRLAGEQAARQAAEAQAEAIRAQREQLRITLESIGDGVIVTDGQAHVTLLNPAAQALTGWSLEQAVGQPLEKIFRIKNEQTGKPAENPVARVIREGVVVGLANHTVLVAQDGTERAIDDCAAPIKDGRGNLHGCVMVFHDVSEKRRAQQALLQAEERMRSVINHVLDAIISIDEQGAVQSFNPAAEKIFGYSASEVVGGNVKVLMPEPFHSEHDGYLANYLRSGQAKIIGIGREVVGRRKDGSTFPMDLAVSEFHMGERRYFTGIVRDITERKRLEQQVQQYTAELEQRVEERTAALRETNAALEAFSYSVSHDLRAPLRALEGIAQALLEDYAGALDSVGQDYARRIVASARHMDTLIQDLLAYSRLSRFDFHAEPVELAGIAAEAVEQLRGEIQGRAAEVTVEEPMPHVLAHRPTLMQVMTNLLGNALKFVAAGTPPHIKVRAERRDGRVRLWVEDNGIGIAPQHHQRIFNVFERLHGDETYPGTGIGLAIVKKGLERMGGRAGVESEKGRGSRFWFELPEG